MDIKQFLLSCDAIEDAIYKSNILITTPTVHSVKEITSCSDPRIKIFKPTFDGADQHATELNIKVNRRHKLKFNFNN